MDLEEVRTIFTNGIAAIRSLESEMSSLLEEDFKNNHEAVCEAIEKIVSNS
jgi:hypothetical protein